MRPGQQILLALGCLVVCVLLAPEAIEGVRTRLERPDVLGGGGTPSLLGSEALAPGLVQAGQAGEMGSGPGEREAGSESDSSETLRLGF